MSTLSDHDNQKYFHHNQIMSANNDITGDIIRTKPSSINYRDGWERIFRKKKQAQAEIIEKMASKISLKAETIRGNANAATESDVGAFGYQWKEI